MADKYLAVSGGRTQEVEATVSSAGAGDAGEIVALDGAGLLDITIMPSGVGPDTQLLEASEDLSAGDMVNIFLDTTAKCRKADATTVGKEAVGFVLAAVTSGQNATVYFEGKNNQLSGLTIGARQYLNTTAGGLVETAPSGSGNVVQFVGVSYAADSLTFEANDAIILA